ncbi:STAS-like domain-containing protein [Variovorax sp. dw_308]|uniref:STAS-like domain-containing protein n=1 Tax=Variovorax sp. dw_308 TaxID=2721546 RepID=UPI001C43F952|nr:STAS-like domain-containing protein [Variovorax sp. dw_308]
MHQIDVPENLEDKGLLNFFSGWRWQTHLSPPVRINFDTCNFIAPYAVTLFAGYALWLREVKGCHLSFQASPHTTAGNYLNQSGFLELMGEQAPAATVGPARTVKLARISSSSEIPGFAASVMAILRIEDEELAGAVKYSLIELLRNVVQHSASVGGGVAMAQYFPRTGLVEVCVADMGLGIKSTINEAYPEIDTHLRALKLVTLPHVSRTFKPGGYTSMSDNAGLGLFFIKQIASLSGGSFFLGSKDAIVDIWGDKEGQQKKLYWNAKAGGWPGTFAYLQLRKDKIGEFDSLLSVCRRLAAEAQKYPAELSLDFVEGIPELGGLDEQVIVSVKLFEEDVEQAAKIRDEDLLPSMREGTMVVLDFDGVKFATQSFVHALMYKVIRDGQNIGSTLSIANCSRSTREAVMAVAAYAKIGERES